MLNESFTRKLVDIDAIMIKRGGFFIPKTKEPTKMSISLRKTKRDNLFKIRRKRYHKHLLNSCVNDNTFFLNEKVNKNKFSLYINQFLSIDMSIKLSGLICLRKLLLLESTEKIENELVKQDIISQIIQLVERDEIELQYEALSFLNIFTSKQKNLNIFSIITPKITSNLYNLQELSLMILSNLTYNEIDDSLKQITSLSIVPKLSSILYSTSNVVKLLALNSLYNIFIREEQHIPSFFNDLETVKEFIGILIKLSIQNKSEIDLLSFVYPIMNNLIGIFKDKIINILYEEEFIITVITSLYVPVNEYRLNLLRFINSLVNYSKVTQIDVLICSNIIEKLKEHLDSNNKSIQKETCRIISYLANMSKNAKIRIIKTLIYKVFNCLRGKNKNSEHFLLILNNLLINIEDKAIFNSIQYEEICRIVIRFIDLTSISNIQITLDIVSLLICYDKVLNNSGQIKLLLINLEIKSKLEKLIFYKNKMVYHKVLELLEVCNTQI